MACLFLDAHHHGFCPQQLEVVWSLALQPDSEGPSLISRTARLLLGGQFDLLSAPSWRTPLGMLASIPRRFAWIERLRAAVAAGAHGAAASTRTGRVRSTSAADRARGHGRATRRRTSLLRSLVRHRPPFSCRHADTGSAGGNRVPSRKSGARWREESARLARRDDDAYPAYSQEEQRSQQHRGPPNRAPDFRDGTLACTATRDQELGDQAEILAGAAQVEQRDRHESRLE